MRELLSSALLGALAPLRDTSFQLIHSWRGQVSPGKGMCQLRLVVFSEDTGTNKNTREMNPGCRSMGQYSES